MVSNQESLSPHLPHKDAIIEQFEAINENPWSSVRNLFIAFSNPPRYLVNNFIYALVVALVAFAF